MNTPSQRRLPVFFDDRMVACSTSFSPSAGKPAQVVASWLQQGLPIELFTPEPVSPAQLSLAHDPGYVADILSMRRANGFGDRSAHVAASLPWTSGSMLSAARHVLRHGGVACAPCSGFHHATYASGGGFCTFNGLMVTACALRADRSIRRVGILDCDQHYGNGTDDIIDKLDASSWVRHRTAGATFGDPTQVQSFFHWLTEAIAFVSDCDVVLFQAGADPHVNDPLGGWLTTGQLRERDARVFEGLRSFGAPVVWNLAGGYQRHPDGSIPRVLEIHENTARECIRTFELG